MTNSLEIVSKYNFHHAILCVFVSVTVHFLPSHTFPFPTFASPTFPFPNFIFSQTLLFLPLFPFPFFLSLFSPLFLPLFSFPLPHLLSLLSILSSKGGWGKNVIHLCNLNQNSRLRFSQFIFLLASDTQLKLASPLLR